jgi:hypothetical protein
MRTEHFFKMEGAIALLFSLFMMTSSVSGQDGNDWWKTFGFTKDEKQVWLKAGFTEEESDWAGMYKKAGISPSVAIADKKKWENAGYERANIPGQWISSGFTLDEAMTWRQAGFENPFLADNYRKGGFEPAEAKKWSEAFHSSYTSQIWKARGFNAESAAQWAEKGYSAEEAYDKCRQAGFPAVIKGRQCPSKTVP